MKLTQPAVYAIAVLAISLAMLVTYSVGLFGFVPDLGLDDIALDGTIASVGSSAPVGLQAGDRLLRVNDLAFDDFRRDLRVTLWGDLRSGDPITYTVARGDETLTFSAVLPPLTLRDVLSNALSQWLLAVVFWLAALTTALVVRPRDTRWRLLLAFNAVTSVWLVASTLSRWHLWDSALVLRIAILLSVPIYWHLHWSLPTPLSRLPNVFLGLLYGVPIGLCLAEALQVTPQSAYFISFAAALGGALAIWIVRWVRRTPIPGGRLLLVAAIATLLPAVVFGIVGSVWQDPTTPAMLGLLALPILPFTYVYMASRRQLGGLELWANRAFAGYLYALVLMFVAGLAAAAVLAVTRDPSLTLAASTLLVGITVLVTILVFPDVQRWVERNLFGLPLEPSRMLASYVAQIVASTDLSTLTQVLSQKVLPSLLVRQSALYQFSELLEPTLVYAQGVAKDALPTAVELAAWRDRRSAASAWVRLALPLEIDGAPIGVLLLGAHDPDDVYTATETATLRSLADQTAIALAHAMRAEQLRLLFQANIERHEAERAALARDLHDDILQQMAVLARHVAAGEGGRAYDAIVAHTRQMISGLRPVMLDYGLAEALEQLADDLAERVGSTPELRVRLDGAPRYSALVEQHAYRIVQQATENALRHAAARSVEIAGRMDPEDLCLTVSDDGVGIPTDLTTSLGALIAQRHFGLAGMVERAQLIGAALSVDARPEGGTVVTLRWPKPIARLDGVAAVLDA